MGLTVRLPVISHDPIEAMIAVVDVRYKTCQASGHVSTDTVLDMLIALGLGEPVRAVSSEAREDGPGTHSPVRLPLAGFDRTGAIYRARSWEVQDVGVLETQCANVTEGVPHLVR